MTAAMRAAQAGDAELLAVCLSSCVCFVRMCALECTHCLCACVPQELIEVGADAAMADDYGRTPAHLAANGHAECLVVLREAGVDLGVANTDGRTPAHYAAGHAECEALLRKWGY